MAHLDYPSVMEVQLRLGAHEDAILSVVRHCSWWTKADVEGQVPDSSVVTGITLTTNRSMDSTIRRILQLSFGLVFPADGGVGVQPVREPASTPRKRGSSVK